MIKLLKAESYPEMKIRSFLLKTYQENHKLEVDGNVDHHISMPIKTMMQCIKIVTEAIEKENTRNQRKLKIATSAITMYTSILMCSVYTLQNL